MHQHVTHNRYYEDFRTFAEAIMRFFKTTLPQGWGTIRDTVNDNFHVIRPRIFGSSGRLGITGPEAFRLTGATGARLTDARRRTRRSRASSFRPA